MNKKGQGALEYLMTYGWALLVIVIVVAALYAMGVLNPSSYAQNQCRTFQHFTFNDQKLNTTTYVLDVTNGGTAQVSVSNLKVGSAAAAAPTVSDADIQPGDRFTLTTTTVPAGLTAGNEFKDTSVVITFSATGGIAGNSDTAKCGGKVASN